MDSETRYIELKSSCGLKKIGVISRVHVFDAFLTHPSASLELEAGGVWGREASGRVRGGPRERMVETCRDERVGAAAKALSSALGPLSAAEAGRGSGFASDGWSH